MTQISLRNRRSQHRRKANNGRTSTKKIVAFLAALILVICGISTVANNIFLTKDLSEDNDNHRDNSVSRNRMLHKKSKVHKAGGRNHHMKHHDQEEKSGSKEEEDDEEEGSLKYNKIRKKYDELLPFHTEEDWRRLHEFMNKIRKPRHQLKSGLEMELPYDVNNCPEEPPSNYPYEWNLLDVLNNWNPNDISSSFRPGIYQGLCRFDYERDFQKAEKYRKAELPFVLRDDPQVLKVAERWNQPDYLSQILGKDVEYTTEYSESNSLMFFRDRRGKHARRNSDWKPPMTHVKITYDEWVEKASQTEEEMGPREPHWYFRVNAKGGTSHFMFKELPFFLPEENFYIVEEEDTRGINCRFGMMGNTAATHFDGSRNFVMLFGGERRYVLSHPKSCLNMGLYPQSHPSGRHSALDWSNPDLEKYPEFAHATANEVVLQAGDVLYLPTHWFHFIVSLDLNWQCNARSGITAEYRHHIENCGFA